jgi:hypothetical protein
MSQPADNKDNDKDKDLQGEGNYDASRRYDKAAHEFAQSGRVEDGARAARPRSPAEADELRQAERAGKSHSKGEDPAVATPATPQPAPAK